MSDSWYYEKDGKPSGPVSTAELQHILLNHPKRRDLLVWGIGLNGWQKARDVPALASPTKPPPIPVQRNPEVRKLLRMGLGLSLIFVFAFYFIVLAPSDTEAPPPPKVELQSNVLENGYTPLHKAAETGDRSLVAQLNQQGADFPFKCTAHNSRQTDRSPATHCWRFCQASANAPRLGGA
jgi:GYF domain 2